MKSRLLKFVSHIIQDFGNTGLGDTVPIVLARADESEVSNFANLTCSDMFTAYCWGSSSKQDFLS